MIVLKNGKPALSSRTVSRLGALIFKIKFATGKFWLRLMPVWSICCFGLTKEAKGALRFS